MSRYCGEILTINQVVKEHKQYRMSECGFAWTDEMIEECVESIEDRMKELRKMCTISLTDSNYTEKVDVLLNDYEYIEENGKAYFVKKKKEYPKTYEECCKIMQVARPTIWFDYDDVSSISKEGDEYECHIENTLCAFRKLLICRDAYLKLYGEEMGLGEPWEPDWTNHEFKYCIKVLGNTLECVSEMNIQCTLAFPTEEMRDAFKENFDPDLEICKEFL